MVIKFAATVSAIIVLSACGGGGGGGGVISTPGPAPAPAPTNSTITDLKASQTFANDASSADLAFDLTTGTTITGKGSADPLTIRYDAASNSYSLAAGPRSQTFSPADVTVNTTQDLEYQKTTGSSRDFLTFAKVPFTGTVATQYVQLGFWQRNIITGARQDTFFSAFTYGIDTPAAAVPRTGTAVFGIDVFGLSSSPGKEPRTFQGSGTFSTDFGAGVFSAHSFLEETELLSGDGVTGGGIELTAAGRLSATNGTFAGNMVYGGFNGSVSGSLAGRFYGPAGQELGAAFSGANADGATVNGALTGRRDNAAQADNLTLTNLVKPQLFFTREALLEVRRFDGQTDISLTSMNLVSQFNQENAETFSYGPGISSLPGGLFTINDKVASVDPNFIAYRKTFAGREVMLELFKPGAVNSQLALTYASLGRWSTSEREPAYTTASQVFFAYGLETPARLLAAKTGTGRYAGVVYGAGANRQTGAIYDVTGTSQFEVDFSSQSYSGFLGLLGAGKNGTASVDFGSYNFSGALAAFTAETAVDLIRAGQNVGTMSTRFYGPGGEEIAGNFSLFTPAGSPGAGTTIVGATVAKRQ